VGCAKGYEKLCVLHEICRLGRDPAAAGEGLPRSYVNALILQWYRAGLIKRQGNTYDTSELCKRYEAYLNCFLKEGKTPWICYRKAGLV
jgi:hypothetical protein